VRASMKAPAPTIDRISRWVAVVASTWFAFASVWGIFGTPLAGHIDAGSAGNVMAAEQMIRWRIQYPAWGWFNGQQPVEGLYICHHPFGQYYVPAAMYWLFGHRDVLIHLPATLMSAAIPPMLYGIGKERWGAPIGAVAAAGYVVVPIALGFATFWNLETICIFGALLFFWGHSRHTTTGRDRYMMASFVGLAFACAGDWVGYLLVAPTLGWSFLRAFVLPPRMTPRLRLVPYARWWAISVIFIVISLAWWLWLFHHVGQINEWLNAGTTRSGGEPSTTMAAIHATLDARKSWIEFSFTPLAIWIGKIAAPICLLRLLVTRLDEETYSLGILLGAVFQYVVFKQGADIHIFWPHYFAAYFALALAQLAGAIGAVVGRVTRWISRPRAQVVAAVTGLAVGLMPVAAMAHDGVKGLWVWRRTGGRYNDNGTQIRSEGDLLFVLRQVVMPKIKLGTTIMTHPSVGWGWEELWTYQGEHITTGLPSLGPGAAQPFWIARGSGTLGDDQRRIASAGHVRIYGDIWVVDQREGPGPVDAFAVNEREPNPLEFVFLGGTEPQRSISAKPDPWLTWEWRTHLGQAATAPSGEPVTPEQLRIAYNVAIANADKASADRWRKRIDDLLDKTRAAKFSGGVRLLGVRVTGGVQPRIESWFECVGAMGDAVFSVRSTVVKRESLSLIDPDPIDREMANPPRMSTKLWRPGFLYVARIVQNHRIGEERYEGTWLSRDGSAPPSRVDGPPAATLAVVP
jgi:4-amino-4-deoxy-L-arabinose transferase-like glycosyltransferase